MCKLLSQTCDWLIHIIDLNPPPQTGLAQCTFHACDITHEEELGRIFAGIFKTHRRVDFVFANAGIGERQYFYDLHGQNSTTINDDDDDADDDNKNASTDSKLGKEDEKKEEGEEEEMPPLPVKGMQTLLSINLSSVITTTHLATHYMLRSPSSTDKSIVMTASCGGLYPSGYCPVYTATKHGVVGFMRGIAPYYRAKHGIRVNAICPGIVRTQLLSQAEFDLFEDDVYTPVEKVASVVGMLVQGRDDGTGRLGKEVQDREGALDVLSGWAVEISGNKHYYRGHVEFADGRMEECMRAADNTRVL